MAMDLNMAFSVLGIEPAKDENLIRSAYHAALPANNPEENPDGFKLLRKAYEQAMAYIKIRNALQYVYIIRTPESDVELEMEADKLEKEFIALCGDSADKLCANDMRLLVYAFINQKEFDKAIAAITSKSSYEQEIKGYYMLLSHMYRQKKDYGEAIKYGRLRLDKIKEKLEEPEAGKTRQFLIHSLSDANLQLGLMFMACARNDAPEDERNALYKEAVFFLDASWNASHDNLAARINLAYCFFYLQEDKKAGRICDELIKRLGEQNALIALKQMIDNRKDIIK